MDPNLRNLKDFLVLYNKVTELCFTRCVDNFNERNLAEHESTCVSRCVNKFAQYNHTMMKVYVEVQTDINKKRMEELEAQQKQLQKENSSNTETASSTITSSPTKLAA